MSFLINKVAELIESGAAISAASLRDSIVSFDARKSTVTIDMDCAKFRELGVDENLLTNSRLQGMVIWYEADKCVVMEAVEHMKAEEKAKVDG